MAQIDALLASVHAEPDSDDARLVFADWLEEQGDPRGELIRLQVRRSRLPAPWEGEAPAEPARQEPRPPTPCPPSPEWFALERREQELLDRHAIAWLGPLYRSAISWEYVRGLLHVEVEAEAFLDEPIETTDQRRAFAWVERLSFRGLTRSLAVVLAHFPHLLHLRTLDLGGNLIGPEGIVELTATRFLVPVTTLDLRGCRVGPDGAAALGSRVRQNAGTTAPRSGERGYHLTRLVLWDNQIGNSGTARLAASARVASLVELDLAHNNIGDPGAQALADSPHLAGLRVLDVRGNRIGDRGAEALAASPHLTGLRRLEMQNNQVTEKGVRALRSAFGDRVAINAPRPQGGGYL